MAESSPARLPKGMSPSPSKGAPEISDGLLQIQVGSNVELTTLHPGANSTSQRLRRSATRWNPCFAKER
jgi:hypothetical protein